MPPVLDWLDARTGYRNIASKALDEKIPGGASLAYVFGSVLLFLLLLQAVTGIILAMYYSPSASDAWGSVAYLQDQVTLGWFVRGLHSYGASAMVIILCLHLLQVALFGAYKKPRELTWITGVLMLGLILAFALTGYLLPWDQKGYWATKVATGIAGTAPVAGEAIQQAAQGGNEYGNLTLTRFFAIHVFILPGALLGLVVLHIYLFRRNGVTPRWDRPQRELQRRAGRFWPDQLFLDLAAMGVVFAAVLFVTMKTGGAELGAPADPSSNYDARPEWYFRPLFQLLKYFEGPMEMLVALGLPPVVGGFLLALPFWDRGEGRDPKRRARYLFPLAGGVMAAGALTAVSFIEDAGSDKLAERTAEESQRAEWARELAVEKGVPAEGGTAIYDLAPHHDARELFDRECAGCHRGPERKGPELTFGYNSRAWIRAFLKDPNGDRFFGPSEIDMMEPVDLEPEKVEALVELVYSQTGAADADHALASRGEEIFEAECSGCHYVDGETEGGVGPNLGGRGTAEMLAVFLARPDHPLWFGEQNEMPAFLGKLSEAERSAMAEYLVWLRTASPEDLGALAGLSSTSNPHD